MSGRTLCLDISKASLFISHVLPQFTLSPVPVPLKASVEHGHRSSGMGGFLFAGRILCPLSEAAPTKTAKDRQHLATTGGTRTTGQAGQEGEGKSH